MIMIHFDHMFLKAAEALSLAILLYKQYVDDVNCIVRKVKKSMQLDKIHMRLIDTNPDHENDMMKDEEEMMTLLREIADRMTTMIKWE